MWLRTGTKYFRESWCAVSVATLVVGCAQSNGGSQPDSICSPPEARDAALSRDPSPLVSADQDSSCRIDEQGRLGLACVPRCGPAVRAPFYACRDTGCEETVLGSDPTPPVSALDGSGERALDCVACVRMVRTLCVRKACPTEAALRDACLARADADACATESTALSNCFLNHQQLYEPCWFLAVETCFSGK